MADTDESPPMAQSGMSPTEERKAPVTFIPGDPPAVGPKPGVALCLSGGGYRAMLFHAGALWRLNDAGLLPRLDRVSSVSGGSIAAGVLGKHWHELDFDPVSGVARRFQTAIIAPLRRLAQRTIDVPSILWGLLIPSWITQELVGAYRKHLFGGATLQDLPERPRFIFNAANVQTGALWRFSRPYMADWRVGRVDHPKVSIAVAVAASAAFPPVLSPLVLPLADFTVRPMPGSDLHRQPYTRRAVLSDGGVYDNLGLETAWKEFGTVLVSDGGLKLGPQARPRTNWLSHMARVVTVVDNQVRSLRKRLLIDSYTTTSTDRKRAGAYWGITTDIANYQLTDALDCPEELTRKLAAVPTRLARLPDDTQQRLINWGYAACDAALRRHYLSTLSRPAGFPYPGGVG
jgi:NTE family protein